MKLKLFIFIQVTLLFVAVIAGLLLKDDISEGPRMIHRLSGQLAGFVAIATTIRTMQLKSPKSMKTLSWLALGFIFLAGLSGDMIKDTTNYDTIFALMRVGGIGALALTVFLLLKVIKTETKDI